MPVTAGDRFAWDQHATDAAELATFRYAFYVDDLRSEAVGVSCSAGEMPDAFVCSSGLPDMSTGSHTIQMTAFVVSDGTVLESPRSAALRVFKQ